MANQLTLEITESGDCVVTMAEGLNASEAAIAIGKASATIRSVCKEMSEHIEANFGTKNANIFFAEVQRADRLTPNTSGTIAMQDTRGRTNDD